MWDLRKADTAFFFYAERSKIQLFFWDPFADKPGQHLPAIPCQDPLLLLCRIHIHEYPDIIDIPEIRMTAVSPLYNNEGGSL